MSGTPPLATLRQQAAGTVVAADWSLLPAGLAGGDQFRLLFLSSTKRDGSSSGIAAYNTFIQNRAAAGHTDIRAYSSGFRVVGCTEAVDARDNTGTTYTSADKGVPIYWLNGAKAADDYEDFYDASWDNEANDKAESGSNGPNTSQAANYPLTGCDHDGTEFLFGSDSWALGNGGNVRVGRPATSGSSNGPIRSSFSASSSDTRPMYGLSEVFHVVSDDATLSSLELTDDSGSAITLTPAFAPGTTDYEAPLASGVDEVTIIPTVNDGGATYEVQDGSGTALVDADSNEADFQVTLSGGPNTIQVVVTASDAMTSSTYTVVVTPPGTVITEDWSLLPAGLVPGDKFRLLFLSSTKRDGSSSDIADYNTFVQDRAAAGHAASGPTVRVSGWSAAPRPSMPATTRAPPTPMRTRASPSTGSTAPRPPTTTRTSMTGPGTMLTTRTSPARTASIPS